MSARKKYAVLFPALLLIAILAILLGGQWPGYCSRSAQGLTRTESYSRSARGLTRTGEFFEASEEFLVNDDFSIADQGYPDIAVDAVGNFRIVWQDNRESNYSVYEQYFAWDGERLGPNTPVNDDANGDEQYDPHIGMSVNGYTKIVWQDYRAAGYPTNPDIYAHTKLPSIK